MLSTRRISIAAAALGACVAWLVLALTPGAAGGNTPRGGPSGQTPFAGTWLAQMDVPYLWYGLVQIHSDGTAWACDQTDMGFAGQSTLDGPNMGSWKRTGPHEITAVTLFFVYDNPHVSYPTQVIRMTTTLTMGKGFDSAVALGSQRFYDLSLGEDPLDPTQGSYAGEVTMSLRRVSP